MVLVHYLSMPLFVRPSPTVGPISSVGFIFSGVAIAYAVSVVASVCVSARVVGRKCASVDRVRERIIENMID
eukprot:11218741-Lingulodinium_polyedra.AAC.1